MTTRQVLVCHITGTAETAIHFVIYEHLKKMMMAKKQTSKLDLTDCMWIAAVAKLTASSMCYPHGECQLSGSTHTQLKCHVLYLSNHCVHCSICFTRAHKNGRLE